MDMESTYRSITVKGLRGEIPLVDFLSSKFTYLSREQWCREADLGFLELNNRRVFGDESVKNGDLLVYKRVIPEPDVDTNYTLIYEDDYTVIIDKPGNLPVHPAGRYRENTLWSLLQKKGLRVKFVNRLDRETSGLLLGAKTDEALEYYNALQQKGEIQKLYRVLVHGCFSHVINARGCIGRNRDSQIRKKQVFYSFSQEGDSVPEGFKEAFTLFKPIQSGEEFSLVECELFTGRLHQIRATLSSLGFPVAGDKMYGIDENLFIKFIEGRLDLGDEKALIFPRQCLHSYSLRLKLYKGSERVFTSDIPWEISFFDKD